MHRSLLILVCAVTAACSAQTPTQQPAPQSQPNIQTAQPAAQPQPGSQTSTPAAPATPAGQTPQPAKPPVPPPAPPDTSAKVAPTQPVITVKGVCQSTPVRKTAGGTTPKLTPTSCETVVTKADFEKLINALNTSNQTIPPSMRRNLAQAYVEFLSFSQAARKAGLDKDPRFLEIMKLIRMRTLEDVYRRNLEEKYRNPPAEEIQARYNQNLPKYEEIKLSRMFIPAKNTAANEKDDWEKKALQVANDIHDRAAKGEDLEKLQKEAFTTLGLTINPPNTAVGTRRRGMLVPAEENELFALKPGEVSKVEQEPAGYIIYKVESRQTLPLEQVKDEISRELFREKMEAGMKAITAAVKADYNEEYFGPAAPPPPPPAARFGNPSAAPPPGSRPSPAPASAPAPATPSASTPPSAPSPAPGAQKPPQ